MVCASQSVPQTKIYRFCKPLNVGGHDVEFRLIYQGPLSAQGSGGNPGIIKEKHAIRKQIHGQLRELWSQHHVLKTMFVLPLDSRTTSSAEAAMRRYEAYGFRWLPLVTEEWGLACSLDILFLRRDNPGNLIESGGDIDNRIKVLLDALRRPRDANEVRGQQPSENETPFFVLLEDDRLINEIKITTDRLLVPVPQDGDIHDVSLVIGVKTIVTNAYRADIELWI